MMTSKHAIALLVFFLAFGVNAQETTTSETTKVEEEVQPVEKSNQGRIEKIEVTGSHIKRIDVEGPSPVLTLDREYLERSGYSSVGDVLRDSAVTSTGVGRESSGSSASGSSTTGLRGFGADKILVLLNGLRLPKIGGGNEVDLNLIPFQAIDRVEILKDGASATYGSDALAGVINFITKKDFDGAAISMKYSNPEQVGGSRQDISAIYGKNFSKGNILGIYQYRSNKGIHDRDREWSKGGLSITGSPGAYKATTPSSALSQVDPNCPPGQVYDDGKGNKYCLFDFTPYSMSLPDLEQHSAVVTGEYDLSSNYKLYGSATYVERMTRWQYAPAPDNFRTEANGDDYSVPNSVAGPGGWNLPGITTEDVEVRYRLVDELGPRASRDTTTTYSATTGLKGYMAETWEWNGSVSYGASKVYNFGHAGYANKRILHDLMVAGSFRPFDASAANDVSAADVDSEHTIKSSLVSTQFVANGEVGQLMGGVLSSALGLSAAWEDFSEKVDDVTQAGKLFGGVGANGQGSRSYQALFAELALSYDSWEFMLAGRFDRYSDFGETFNPKFAFKYKPIKSLLFRGSVGTGFKAPSLTELYSAQGYGYPTFKDQTGCNSVTDKNSSICKAQQYKVFSGGNSSLKEETSFSYNIGTLYQPTRNLNFSLDYWFTEISDAIGLDLDDLMSAEIALGNAALPAYGVEVRRDGSGVISEVVAPNLNLAKQQAEGLDFNVSYTMKLGALTIHPEMNHSHVLKYKEEVFPGLGLVSKLDNAGRPRWRNTAFVTFGLYEHSLRATGRTVASQFKDAHTSDASDKRRLATYTEYDLNYRYKAFWNGEITLGVKNLLGTNRPLDDTAGFADILNSSLYDQIGRLYYVGYSQSF